MLREAKNTFLLMIAFYSKEIGRQMRIFPCVSAQRDCPSGLGTDVLEHNFAGGAVGIGLPFTEIRIVIGEDGIREGGILNVGIVNQKIFNHNALRHGAHVAEIVIALVARTDDLGRSAFAE